jgi:hypothetical protein
MTRAQLLTASAALIVAGVVSWEAWHITLSAILSQTDVQQIAGDYRPMTPPMSRLGDKP